METGFEDGTGIIVTLSLLGRIDEGIEGVVAVQGSAFGYRTFRTCRASLTMSGGRTDLADKTADFRECPHFGPKALRFSALHNYRSHYVLAVENPSLVRYHRSGLEAREEDATTHFVEGIAAFRQRPGRSDVGRSLTLANDWRSRSQAERAQLNLHTQAKE